MKSDFAFPAFDLSKFDMSKMFGEFKMPGLDGTALAAAQKKNLDALAAANKKAMEGYQALAKRQAEIFQEGMEEMATMMKGAMIPGGAEANAAKQAEQVKVAFEKGLAHMRELAEMAAKTNAETYEMLNQRMNEAMEEMRAGFPKPGAKK